VFAEQCGWDAFWTVEHHFLEEYSHCSNPEVLYGAIAARTTRMRLGYGVRLMPKPYNHPDPHRRVGRGARPALRRPRRLRHRPLSTRPELEGFDIDPRQTRAMWQEAIQHVVGAWTNDEYAFEGKYWRMPKRRVLPKPLQSPHPPLWGATSSEDGHQQIGELGLGLCSFAVGVPPRRSRRRSTSTAPPSSGVASRSASGCTTRPRPSR
jgi:alkanesulfonate monooxygenase SsuD/methylene tetrahydromethanopterin reductase-like flavin-dependent oxidoreductase (luciferase family)